MFLSSLMAVLTNYKYKVNVKLRSAGFARYKYYIIIIIVIIYKVKTKQLKCIFSCSGSDASDLQGDSDEYCEVCRL